MNIPHTCHWPGCAARVPPRLWGCRPHWFALPDDIRREIWRTYRPGQEIDKAPSSDYLAAVKRAHAFALESRRRRAELLDQAHAPRPDDLPFETPPQ